MAEYSKKLKIEKGGQISEISLYTTQEETGSPYLSLQDESMPLYAKLSLPGGSFDTPLRVIKSGKIYVVQSDIIVKGAPYWLLRTPRMAGKITAGGVQNERQTI